MKIMSRNEGDYTLKLLAEKFDVMWRFEAEPCAVQADVCRAMQADYFTNLVDCTDNCRLELVHQAVRQEGKLEVSVIRLGLVAAKPSFELRRLPTCRSRACVITRRVSSIAAHNDIKHRLLQPVGDSRTQASYYLREGDGLPRRRGGVAASELRRRQANDLHLRVRLSYDNWMQSIGRSLIGGPP